MKIAAWIPLVVLSCACARPAVATAPPVTARAPVPHVYRLAFVFSASDAAGAERKTAFTMNLEEEQNGEVLVGRNVPLVVNASGFASPRQDVGLKIAAHYDVRGDDVLLFVSTELSALEAPSEIRKLVTRGQALAEPGKATVVASLDDDHKHYQLAVTPTKLR